MADQTKYILVNMRRETHTRLTGYLAKLQLKLKLNSVVSVAVEEWLDRQQAPKIPQQAEMRQS